MIERRCACSGACFSLRQKLCKILPALCDSYVMIRSVHYEESMDLQSEVLLDAEAALLAERPRLVRLCQQLSADPDVAEDLAQEALIVAWRNRATLREPQAYHAWLNGIARNVYLRGQRQHVREQQRRVPPPYASTQSDPLHNIVADVDLDMELLT